jgi:hypothetical protein
MQQLQLKMARLRALARGRLTAKQARLFLLRFHRARLRQCDISYRGQLQLRLRLVRTGKVRSVQVKSSEPARRDVERCVSARLRKVQFPRTSSPHGLRFTLSLRFNPALPMNDR